MAEINNKFPETSKSFYTDDEADIIQKKLGVVLKNYNEHIRLASRLCNIPPEVILAVIFIESSGINKNNAPYGYGLMQVSPGMASDGIYLENKKGRLSPEEKSIIKGHLGSRLDCILKMHSPGHQLPCNQNSGIAVTPKDLNDPKFNILIGSIVLGQLIDDETVNGKVRFDKVIIRYNSGYNRKPPGKDIDETLKYASKKGGKETVAYITKFLGKNGLMDILFNKMTA